MKNFSRSRRRSLRVEQVEGRQLLAALSFLPRPFESGVPKYAAENSVSVNQVVFADVDSDRDADILATTYRWSGGRLSHTTIVPFENVDGTGRFQQGQAVATETLCGTFTSDIDLNGTVDIIQACDTELAWYGNRDGSLSERHTIDAWNIADERGKEVLVADVDGDDLVDVVWKSLETLKWYRHEDGLGTFGPPRLITPVSAQGGYGPTLNVVDLDKDGDTDLATLICSFGSCDLVFHENVDGVGSFEEAARLPVPDGTVTADIDDDKDVDVLSYQFSDRLLVWLENSQDEFATRMISQMRFKPDITQARHLIDLDNDGDVDVITEGAGLWWSENTDGKGGFGQLQKLVPTAGFFADLDGDGDLDLVPKDGRGSSWYENRLTGDLDDDDKVSFQDFLMFSANFGKTDVQWDDGDLNADGGVDFADFLLLSANFGAERSFGPPNKL